MEALVRAQRTNASPLGTIAWPRAGHPAEDEAPAFSTFENELLTHHAMTSRAAPFHMYERSAKSVLGRLRYRLLAGAIRRRPRRSMCLSMRQSCLTAAGLTSRLARPYGRPVAVVDERCDMTDTEDRDHSLRGRWARARARRRDKQRERALRHAAAEADRARYNPNKPGRGGPGGGDGGAVGGGGVGGV